MPGPRSVISTDEDLRRGAALEPELDVAAARVLERVARDLGHRRGDARLVLGVEAEQRRDLPRALAREHDVALVADRHPQESRASRPPPAARPPTCRRGRGGNRGTGRRRSASDAARRARDSGRTSSARSSPSECSTSVAPVGQGYVNSWMLPHVVPGGAVVRDQAPGAAVGQDGPRDVADARRSGRRRARVDLGDRDGGAARRRAARRGCARGSRPVASVSRWRKMPTAACRGGRRERAVTEAVGHQDDGAFRTPPGSAQASPDTCSPG